MKSCAYCGKQYGDDAPVCLIDGQPLGGQKAERSPSAGRAAFDVRLVSPASLAGSYRVFVLRDDLVFIQTQSGAHSAVAALAPLLGPVGNLIPLVLWLTSRKKTKARQQLLNDADPENLFSENPGSFKLNQAEIRDAAIGPPSWLATSGKAGRLDFLVRHGEKIRCEFPAAADVWVAVSLLPPLLNATLRINVEWNDAKQRFQKKAAK